MINQQFVKVRRPNWHHGKKLSFLVAKGRKDEGLSSGFNSKSNEASEKVEFSVPSCLLCQGQGPNRKRMRS